LLVQTLPAAGAGVFTTGMCFDLAGNLLLTMFSDGNVALYNADGTLANPCFMTARLKRVCAIPGATFTLQA
jgi:hypothetical protein